MRFDPISIPMVETYGDIDTLHDEAVNLRITRPNVVCLACNSASFVLCAG
jgi:hypothetical protein